jgi:5-deoxy-D-glucuronate isomerase
LLIKNRAEFNALVKVFEYQGFELYTFKNIGPHNIRLLPKKEKERLVFTLKGTITVNGKEVGEKDMAYVPIGDRAEIAAAGDAVIYVAEAQAERKHDFYVKKYADADRKKLGHAPFQRTVVTVIGEKEPAERFIAGYVEGSPGEWSSYPPHRHDDKPEAYVFYGINPGFAVQLVLDEEEQRAYVVHDYDTVLVTKGYHPHVSTSLTGSNYAWVIAAPPSRRTLDVEIHPAFKGIDVGQAHYKVVE